MTQSFEAIEASARYEDSEAASAPSRFGEFASAARAIGTFTALVGGWAVLNVALFVHRL